MKVAILDFFFNMLATVFCALPRRTHLMLANAMGYLWFDILKFRRKHVIDNLNLAYPDKPESWKVLVGRKSIQNLCLSFLDYFVLYKINKENVSETVVLENVETLRAQYEKKEGVLVLSLHLGTIDLAPAGLGLHGFPMSITLKKINNEVINTFIENLRKSKGVNALADRRNPFEIFRAVKRGDVTVFVMDQYMGKPHGIEAKFFGQPAGTASGLAGFSLKTNLPVIAVYNFRRADGKIYIVSEPPIWPEVVSESFEENIRYNTQKYNDKIEEIVRRHPEQWMWVHRRWKNFK